MATKPKAVAVTKPKEKISPLTRDAFGLWQHKRQTHNAYIPHGVTFEETLDPFFWSFVATSIRDNDRIEMVAEDGTWMATCHVKLATTRTVSLEKLNYIEFDSTQQVYAVDDWLVKWNGPSHKWVYIDPTGEIVEKGYSSEADAMKALTLYRRKIAA